MKKHKVFYIHGFDPRGAPTYHKMYSKEAEKQAKLTGAKIKVGKRTKGNKFSSIWNVEYTDSKNDISVQSEYEFLKWDDIIRKNWMKEPIKLLVEGVKAYFHYISSGTWWKVANISVFIAITLSYPLIFFVFMAAIAIMLPYFIFSTVLSLNLPFSAIIATITSIGVFWAVIRYMITKMRKLNILWLLRIYIYCSRYSKYGDDDFDARIDVFVELIHQALSADNDQEILIVGHSFGSIVTSFVIAEMLVKYPDADYNKLNILTLGQIIPVLSILPEATNLQDNLKIIAKSDKIKWIDCAAPSDGACFALTGPFVNVCEEDIACNLKLISPRFHKMFAEDDYKVITKDKFRIHFQYLMASEKIVDYDYFKITATNSIEELWNI